MNDTTFQGNGKITYVPVVVNAKPPKQTNADRIRVMTDEELAAWFEELHDRNTCPEFGAWDCNPSCKKCWLEWLKQEAQCTSE